MNREIKFRAWDNEDKEMYYSDKNCVVSYDNVGESIFLLGDKTGKELANYELMQYTNMKDRNGKEIYEGDILIVVTYSYEEPLIDTTCVVKYDNEHCLYNFTEIGYGEIYSYSMIEIGDSFKYELEVIGNIHENPELLEVE